MTAKVHKMKILMTADTTAGVWTYAIELIRALGGYGVDVTLATMGTIPTSEQRAQATALDNLELRTSDYKMEWMEDPWSDVELAGKWLLFLEQEIEPDLIHLNNYAHGYLPWKAPVVIVGHSCALSWWQAVNSTAATGDWERYSSEVARGLRYAAMVLSPSKTTLEVLEDNYWPFTESAVVYNCRDPRLCRAKRKEDFILAAGRIWDESANIAALEQVAPRLEWPVFVAGAEQEVEGGCIDSGNIRLLGRAAPQGLLNWFARASIYAHPARYEPFGFSTLDAGLAGCALVLGDIPSLREIWEGAAIFVPPDDTKALEDALQLLITDELRRRDLAERAMARAQDFSPQRAAEGYLAAYRNALGSKARGGIIANV
jgi:glycosyltransferase involved in cell wall biosynthesis